MRESNSPKQTTLVAIIVALITALGGVTAAYIGKVKNLELNSERGKVMGENNTSCSVGYEGQYCQTEMRQKFVGIYSGKIMDGNGKELFPLSICVLPDYSNILKLNLFWGTGTNGTPVSWHLSLTGSSSLEIPTQFINNSLLTPGLSYSDEGVGSVKDNQLNLKWTQKIAGAINHYTFLGSK